MINDKKLLCAFIYSAYDSGYCGLMLSPNTKKEHMLLYQEYLVNEKYYPEKEIRETQKKMMESVKTTSIREYIYGSHNDVVKQRIEDDTKKSFEEVISESIRKNELYIVSAALNCPVNFYKVQEIKGSQILGEDLVFKQKRTLNLLEGLEKLEIGDLVSAHWNYVLEKIDSHWSESEKFKKINNEYVRSVYKIITEAKKK